MSLITFQGRQVSIPQEAHGLVCRSDPAQISSKIS